MSKLSEYIKLIPAGLKNLPKIIEGVRNNVKLEFGTLSDEKVDVITTRRLICSECPFNSLNATKMGMYKSDRTDKHCTFCGCLVSLKTAALESNCGIEIYNTANPDKPLPLKWEKIEL